MTPTDPRVLVLAPGDTGPGINNARGHLFEAFVGRLLHVYGYEAPTPRTLNVSADGIELDVVATTRLGGKRVVAECKAYTRPVKAAELSSFYGKLNVERFTTPDTLGMMVVVPRLTPDGEQQARAIAAHDKNFIYLPAETVAKRLRDEGIVSAKTAHLGETSDDAIVITPDGVFSTCILLDATTRTPIGVAVWSASGSVPPASLDLLAASDFVQGLPVSDVGEPTTPARVASTEDGTDVPVLVTVKGSAGDFEYQLPASPKFFVGRKKLTQRLTELLIAGPGTVVLNAQSGWGKSSLALKFSDLARAQGGYAIVLDSRTATGTRYVIDALRRAAVEAASDGLISLPADASWGSLASSLRTLGGATWNRPRKPLLVFFDQFENVFRSETLTRSFRDLAVATADLRVPITVGFAWKTDLVGWTESHPYQLRDEIRSSASVLVVEPFGSSEVSTLLKRLEKALNEKLSPDLRTRLREYSQGLPWLLKKLSDHVLREVRGGTTQDRLLADALNVQSLFDADLAELTPIEQEAVKHVARYAPLPASEVTDRFAPQVVQSLVDRRLVVQIGERVDTYWDTFRDYLNTGRVPVEDSYILRQTPNGVARILPSVIAAGGSIQVKELTTALQTSPNVIFNLSRELRLLGATVYDPTRVTIVEEVLTSDRREQALRRIVTQSLKRHRAFSALQDVAERGGGIASTSAFANELPRAFPSVSVEQSTWVIYGRVFLAWFSYAGLAREFRGKWQPRPEGDLTSSVRLLDPRPVVRSQAGVPQEAPRRALEILRRLAAGEDLHIPPDHTPDRDAVRSLLGLRAVRVDQDRRIAMSSPSLVDANGDVNAKELAELLAAAPGGAAGLAVLRRDARANPIKVGSAIREAAGAEWTPSSTYSIGGYFRSWARAAGVAVRAVDRSVTKESQVAPSLF